MQLAHPPENYCPRACDCDYCTCHRAAYVSDAHGSLALRIHDERAVGKYAQGDQLAEFVLCRNCGVLIGAVYRFDGRLFAAVNANIALGSRWGGTQAASPKRLPAAEKIKRWQSLWFPDVTVGGYGA